MSCKCCTGVTKQVAPGDRAGVGGGGPEGGSSGPAFASGGDLLLVLDGSLTGTGGGGPFLADPEAVATSPGSLLVSSQILRRVLGLVDESESIVLLAFALGVLRAFGTDRTLGTGPRRLGGMLAP